MAADWDKIVADVRPFLDPTADPRILVPENLARVLACFSHFNN
jgi:hypothetical protein